MAVDAILQSIGFFPSGENMVNNQFHTVKFNKFGRWQLSGANGDIHGIVINAPISGEAANVVVFGVSKAELGATVLAGRALTTDGTTGRLKEGNGPIFSLQGGDAGDIISVFISVNGGAVNSVNVGVRVETDLPASLNTVVDSVDTALANGVKWLAVLTDKVSDLKRYFEVSAFSSSGGVSHTVSVKHGDNVNVKVDVVELSGDLQLKVLNNHTEDLTANILRLLI